MLDQTIINSIVAWNQARYDQVYNQTLAEELLYEELEEYELAADQVDKLDALCDLTYIAVGILWKMGVVDKDLSLPTIEDVLLYRLADIVEEFACATTKEYRVKLLVALIDSCEDHSWLPPVLFNKAMLVVCKSNDTKPVKKFDPAIKANIDKGPEYVPPEPELAKILEVHYNNEY